MPEVNTKRKKKNNPLNLKQYRNELINILKISNNNNKTNLFQFQSDWKLDSAVI